MKTPFIVEKPSLREKLGEAFEIEAEPVNKRVIEMPPPDASGSTEAADIETVRKMLYELLGQSATLVEATTNNALSSTDPEMHTAAAKAQKEMREHIVALAELARPKKSVLLPEVKEKPALGEGSVTNQAVFIGTTAELLKIMRQEIPGRTIEARAEPEDEN